MKKKIILTLFVFLSIFIVTTKSTKAAVSCPSSDMSCQQLDAQGGCASGCINIVTPGGKGPTYCRCDVLNPVVNLDCGSPCQTSSQCGTACPGCRANGPGTAQTCQGLNTATPTPGPGDLHGNCGANGISTAIGCVPVLGNDNGVGFYGFLLGWAIGIAGGIAFLLIVYAGFMIMTSSGNPERLKAGQELLTSAISGLVLLVFSVFILNFIGVKILQIPGLTK